VTSTNIYEIPVIMELRTPDSLNSTPASVVSGSISSSSSSIMTFDVSLAFGYQFPPECKLKELWEEHKRKFFDAGLSRPKLFST
jgi:hypothetical protein